MPLVIRNRLLAIAASLPPYPGRRPCDTAWLIAWASVAVICVSLGAVLVTLR